MLERIASPSELAQAFDHRAFARGETYLEEGRVLESRRRAQRGHEVVTGRVRGSGHSVYDVYVLVENGPLGLSVDGDCSCPVGYNCKHVASVVLDQLQHQGRTPGAGAPPQDPEARREKVALNRWLGKLDEAVKGPAPALYPDHQPLRILYLLELADTPLESSALAVKPVMCRQLKRGGYGKTTPFSAARAWQPHPPDYLLGGDVEVLRRLSPEPFAPAAGRLTLEGTAGAEVLERMLRTGRCHWLDKDAPALELGDSRTGTPAWEIGRNGQQRMVFHTEVPVRLVAPLSPPWYIDPDQNRCGPLETALEPTLAGTLASAPPLSPAQVQAFASQLTERFPDIAIPRPREVRIKDLLSTPTPCLRLLEDNLARDLGRTPYHLDSEMLSVSVAHLGFDYGGHQMDFEDDTDAPVVKDGDGLLRIQRDRGAEHQAFLRLLGAGLAPLTNVIFGLPKARRSDLVAEEPGEEPSFWPRFQLETVPELEEAGWRIDIEDSFPYLLVKPEEWYGELDEGAAGGWFDLELGVVVDGRRISLLPLLLDWLRYAHGGRGLRDLQTLPDDTPLSIRLRDRSLLALPLGRVRTVLEVLVELFDPETTLEDGRLRLSAWRAAQLPDLEKAPHTATGWRWLGGERLRALGERLKGFEGISPVPAPEGFQANLRPYQEEGLTWLQFLREYELGGVLADDMGLGKTVQTLAHLLTEKRSGRTDRPSLVVAPTSLMSNWRMEAARFAAELKVLTLHGPDRGRHFDTLADYDLVLTTYALLSRDREVLQACEYHLLILDEAQNIKNPRAQATQCAQQLSARHRLCLTGTPMENHLGELWSLFHFLQPGLLGEQRQFRRLFRTPIEKHGDGNRQASLSRRVAPFMLRRTKDKVAGELPPKTEIARGVELQGPQRELYETIRVAMHDKVRRAIDKQGMARSHIVILDALLKLRQVCCDPRLVKLEKARMVRESAKLRLLMDLVPEMVEEGRRILLFSQFTTMLGLIEDELAQHGLDYVKLTGRTRDRAQPIERFQAGEVPIFLISLKAGGTGLNLTAADTVIHYDPWWNPAVENQATDRAHRLGQDKPVFVYRLITAGTVEEKMIALQQHKRELAEALFSDSGRGTGALSREDLEILFRPLEEDA